MPVPIIDSSILIDCLRGNTAAIKLLEGWGVGARPRTHLFVAAELIAGARDKQEMALIDSFLDSFDLALPTVEDGVSALDLYRRHRLSNGVDWPDCQIAATAIRLDAEVLTQNVKHFSVFAGLRVIRGY